jgi:hypothetical protein
MDKQCKGMTKNGTRCKNTGNPVNSYCSIHQDQYKPLKETKATVAPSLEEKPKKPPVENPVSQKTILPQKDPFQPYIDRMIRIVISTVALLLGLAFLLFSRAGKKRKR